MIRSKTALHGRSPQTGLTQWEIKLPNNDQIYKFSGQCDNCDYFIYRHPAEAGAVWHISGEISRQYGGINRICSFCYK
jgi:hypothetical protein